MVSRIFGVFGFMTIVCGSSPSRQRTVMELSDRALTCAECGAEFVFSAGEQVFHQVMEFTHEPKRCKLCRAKHRLGTRRVRLETRITCSTCGTETTVPFKPTQGRPVLCRACYQTRSVAEVT